MDFKELEYRIKRATIEAVKADIKPTCVWLGPLEIAVLQSYFESQAESVCYPTFRPGEGMEVNGLIVLKSATDGVWVGDVRSEAMGSGRARKTVSFPYE